MAKVRISRRRGEVEGVPAGTEPSIELDLEPGETVASFELQVRPGGAGEQFVDWRWSAFVVTPVEDAALRVVA